MKKLEIRNYFIEGIDQSRFKAIDSGETWNGGSVPFFNYSQLIKMLDILKAGSNGDDHYLVYGKTINYFHAGGDNDMFITPNQFGLYQVHGLQFIKSIALTDSEIDARDHVSLTTYFNYHYKDFNIYFDEWIIETYNNEMFLLTSEDPDLEDINIIDDLINHNLTLKNKLLKHYLKTNFQQSDEA
jgi:hypothetical protein